VRWLVCGVIALLTAPLCEATSAYISTVLDNIKRNIKSLRALPPGFPHVLHNYF